MANSEYVEILKRGAEAWNVWRQNESDDDTPDLTDANFIRMDLHGANLHGADLSKADLYRADLIRADLSGADLSGADLSGADLRWADLNGANLSKACLSGLGIRGANLVGADLREVNLCGADLCRADLRNSNLCGADLSGANLSAANLGETVFGDTVLRDVVGLETCEHWGPSTLDHRTIARSGELPLEFLRGCGLPDRLIEYLPSLLDQAIQLYSCFISFTEADDAFAERLYNDLQGKGVRCWRWKEDARGGRSLIGEVDRAVRLYDKLIVVCSDGSLHSGPVIREIERALQREDQLVSQGETPEVLFPVRLDDAVFEWDHPLKADVVGKVVSDFGDWKDHDAYQKAFEKLLRDLRIET